MNRVVRPVLPLPGPLAQDPTPVLAELAGSVDLAPGLARTMLASATVELARGVFDDAALAVVSGLEPGTIAAVASLFRRAWQAGASAGRVEAVDAADVAGRVAELGAELEELGARYAAARLGVAGVQAAVHAYLTGPTPGDVPALLASIETAIGGAR